MANELPLEGTAPVTSRGRGKLLALAAGVILVLVLAGISALGVRQASTDRPAVGSTAPTFSMPLFDGPQVDLAALRGKPVVINFWASWCVPCEDEAGDLERTWQKYKDRAMFLGVDYVDTEPKAREFLKRFGITYPNGPDLGSRISYPYRIKGVPETFVIDKNGQVRLVKIGPTTEAELSATLDELLK